MNKLESTLIYTLDLLHNLLRNPMAVLRHPKILTYKLVRCGFGAPLRLALGLLMTVLQEVYSHIDNLKMRK